ncbi:hypothetical protein PRVXT_002457 [Proteinivorax tanatarense]|uniref:Uncharacterized protein n=1 Tax=Proteinivorax tanatarense TaxID=1260629 RepID=A0AAU7VK67_9FIRM
MRRLKELNNIIESVSFNKLWDGFNKTKYAIYNDKNFYVNDNEGLELELIKDDFCYIGKTDERFAGNTAIKIDNNYIAIWNEENIRQGMSNEKLASLIIHEMFHCFQLANDESRFANELLGISYPMTIENINLRTLERQYLFDANHEIDKEKKMKLITLFYNTRKRREQVIGNIIEYEKAIETIEGAAVYVEYKALEQLMSRSSINLAEYIKGFTDITEKNLNIRHSSYNQGLLLGLIADEYIPNWKERFSNSTQFLSDFILSELKINEIKLDYKHENLKEIEGCIANWKEQRDLVFNEFERKTKRKTLEDGFQITGFDPMNIVKRDQEIIHKNFLKVKIDSSEQVIKGPIKALIGKHIFDVKKIEW